MRSRIPITSSTDLRIVYTPGVARVCSAIAEQRAKAWQLTIKGNAVAVVSDGSAVLGLGNIGPEAAMPVMEGKAMLFKEFAGIDAYPICLRTQDTEEIINTVANLSVQIASKVIEKEVNEATHRQLVDNLIRDLAKVRKV